MGREEREEYIGEGESPEEKEERGVWGRKKRKENEKGYNKKKVELKKKIKN